MGPLDALHMMLKQQTIPEDVAAIVIEPIMGTASSFIHTRLQHRLISSPRLT